MTDYSTQAQVRNARLAEHSARQNALKAAARWRIGWAVWVVVYFLTLVLAELLALPVLSLVLTWIGVAVATLMLCLEVYRTHGWNQD